MIATTDRYDIDCDSLRRDECQTEEALIAGEPVEQDGVTVVHLQKPLRFRHLAQQITGPNGEDMSLRAEVARAADGPFANSDTDSSMNAWKNSPLASSR